MTWFKIDDALHSHRKAVRAGISAMGLWVMAGSWCADHLSDGFIPDYMAARLDRDYEENAGRLVDAGLWEPTEKGGDKGWQFHEWTDHQPTREEVQAAAAKKSSGGKLGNHRRWHTETGKTDPHCPFCADIPSQRHGSTDRSTDGTSNRSPESVANPPTRPDPSRPKVPSEPKPLAAVATGGKQPALAGMPEPPTPEIQANDIVAAFHDRCISLGQEKPTSGIVGRVSRDAKRLLEKEDVTGERLLASAKLIAEKGWQSLESGLRHLSAQNNNTPAPSNGAGYQSTRHTPFKNPETIDAYHGDL